MTVRQCHSSLTPFVVQITNCIANEAVGGRAGHCFPFYLYDEGDDTRQENITDWVLDVFQSVTEIPESASGIFFITSMACSITADTAPHMRLCFAGSRPGYPLPPILPPS